MKYIYLALSITLAVCSFYLALNQIDGWGWFLAGSIATFDFPDSEKEK